MKPGRVYVKKVPGKRYLRLCWINPETGAETRRSSGTSRRREAERLAHMKERELSRGYAGDVVTWEAFCGRYRDEVQAKLAPKTRSDWRTVRISLNACIAPSLLQDVTAEAVSRWHANLRAEGKTVDTCAKYLRTLAAALKWAAAIRLIDEPPYIAVPKRTRSIRAMKGRPITRVEFQSMLDAIPKVGAILQDARASWEHTLKVLWYSGIRLEEVPLLGWDESADLAIVRIDDDRPLLRVRMEHEKGGRDRLIGLTPDFVAYLRQTPKRERNGLVCKPLVRSQSKDNPMRATSSEATIGRRISEIGRAAEVVVDGKGGTAKHATAHDLRRSFGTRWASRVVPVVLKELMRHSSVRTTEQFYVRLHAEQTADAVWAAFGTEFGDPFGDPCDPDVIKLPTANDASSVVKERYEEA